MNIQYHTTNVLVRDIQVSAEFYTQLLGQRISEDYGNFVLFDGGFALHQADELIKMTYGEERESALAPQGKDNILIYFETEDLEKAYERMASAGVSIIHPIRRQAWGQSVFRFHDPDGHIVEIGEPL